MNPLAEVLDSLGPVVTTLGPVGLGMAAAARAVWAYAKSRFEARDREREQERKDARDTAGALAAAQLARIARLEGEIDRERAERERERNEAKSTEERLGKRLDEERRLREEDADRMATAVLKKATIEQASRGAADWSEAPTKVRNRLELAKGAASVPPDPLRNWDPYEKTPR